MTYWLLVLFAAVVVAAALWCWCLLMGGWVPAWLARVALAIEARRAATTGAVEDESAGPKGNAPNQSVNGQSNTKEME